MASKPLNLWTIITQKRSSISEPWTSANDNISNALFTSDQKCESLNSCGHTSRSNFESNMGICSRFLISLWSISSPSTPPCTYPLVCKQASGKLESFLAKRRKKNAAKEHVKVPFRREEWYVFLWHLFLYIYERGGVPRRFLRVACWYLVNLACFCDQLWIFWATRFFHCFADLVCGHYFGRSIYELWWVRYAWSYSALYRAWLFDALFVDLKSTNSQNCGSICFNLCLL